MVYVRRSGIAGAGIFLARGVNQGLPVSFQRRALSMATNQYTDHGRCSRARPCILQQKGVEQLGVMIQEILRPYLHGMG